MGKTRIRLLYNDDTSFYGYLATTIPSYMTKDPRLDTAACLAKDESGELVKIVFNDEFMSSLDRNEQTFVYIHEIVHYLSRHFTRQGGRNHDRWNCACDYAVNEIITSSFPGDGPKIPEKALKLTWEMKKKLNNDYCAEAIYKILDDEQMQKIAKSLGKGEEGNPLDLHPGWGDISEIPDDQIRVQLADAITCASKAAGTTPSQITTLIDELLKPKINWQQVLRHVIGMGRKASDERTWSRLDRRYGDATQGKRKKRTGLIVTIIDTSGSISDEELKQFISELAYQYKHNEVIVIFCDAEVHEVVKYKRHMKFNVTGRGGTNMNPALEEAKKYKANTIVLLTDGGLCAAPIDTAAKQVWVLTNDGTDLLIKDKTVIRMAA